MLAGLLLSVFVCLLHLLSLLGLFVYLLMSLFICLQVSPACVCLFVCCLCFCFCFCFCLLVCLTERRIHADGFAPAAPLFPGSKFSTGFQPDCSKDSLPSNSSRDSNKNFSNIL